MYDIEPRERSVLGFPLDLINDTQGGYGVPEYRDRDGITGAPADEGIWQTDLATDETRLLLSLAAAVEAAADPFLAGGNQYFFHTKWNPRGTRILQVLRTLFPGRPEKKGWNPTLLTMRADGSAIRKTVSREHWRQGGNHPNWHPDGDHIVMNLTPAWLGDPNRRFVSVHHSGEDLRILSRRHLGSGHMRVTPDWRYLVADCYQREPMADASARCRSACSTWCRTRKSRSAGFSRISIATPPSTRCFASTRTRNGTAALIKSASTPLRTGNARS